MIDDLVDIVYPLPDSPGADADEHERDGYGAWLDEVVEQRERFEQNLRMAERFERIEDPRYDALLAEIGAARRERLDAEARMRMLVAYGREFIKPQPYQLKDLAAAAGMSISGTRSSYTVEDIAAVARRIGRQPRFRAEDTSTD
ncbi:hypothetical protein DMP23_43055 [Amycolatopsis sp. A1MSW2902]